MIRNRVLFVLVLAAAVAALTLAFLGFAPNRLANGRAIGLAEASGPAGLTLIFACATLLAGACFARQGRLVHLAALAAALVLLLLLPFIAGRAADTLVAMATPIARTSLAGGFWIMELAAALAIGDALRRLQAGLPAKAALVIGIVAVLAIAGWSGSFDQLSLAKEAANRREAFLGETERHGFLVALSVLLALLLGVPLGIAAQRRPRWHNAIFGVLDIIQTIPSIALFGLLIGPLAALSTEVPALRSLGISGIGVAPAVIALVLYSLLPMARGAYAGLASVPASVIETARGMGMTGGQILVQVEAPIALPVLLSGLRIVTVQAIGLAVVAALIGAGGLGSFVFLGLGQRALDLMLLGAIPTIFMALGVDFIFQLLLSAARRSP
ncbi:osmoprotectant transport system permease protein [Rhizobiales bacterium GAS188]|nr:osmoprotectant transport system permease protein [Rhizobiales bacterium GAS188]